MGSKARTFSISRSSVPCTRSVGLLTFSPQLLTIAYLVQVATRRGGRAILLSGQLRSGDRDHQHQRVLPRVAVPQARVRDVVELGAHAGAPREPPADLEPRPELERVAQVLAAALSVEAGREAGPHHEMRPQGQVEGEAYVAMHRALMGDHAARDRVEDPPMAAPPPLQAQLRRGMALVDGVVLAGRDCEVRSLLRRRRATRHEGEER